MGPISQIDQLVMLLRQRLLEKSKAASARSKLPARSARAGGADSLKALAAIDTVDDHQLHRALIQNLLADQFGRDLVNDTKFQQVVERVTETLEADETGGLLLNRFIRELRESAR